MSDSLQPHGLQHARLPCPSPTPGTCLNPCSSSQWCHPIILSSVFHFSSCLQYLPASWSFLMSQLFASCGQSIGALDSASVLPMNTQDWSHLGLTGLISLQSKGLSSIFSKTTVQKHQFEMVTGRKKRGFHTGEIGCKCQTFLVSFLSGRRKQTMLDFSPPSLYKFKRQFLLKFCITLMTPGST